MPNSKPPTHPPRDQAYDALRSSIEAVNKSVDSLSVKLDGITNIAMSMSNEIARLDERVTFALTQQKGHAAEMTEIKHRLTKLESYDMQDSRMKDLTTKVFLILLSALITGVFMYLTNM